LIFFSNDTLFIGEFKYSDTKKEQSKNGLLCIEFKKYSERVLNYLECHHKEIRKYCKYVLEYSLAFNDINGIEVDFSCGLIEVDNLKLETYKSEDFVTEIRKNRNKFTKIFNELI